jgi:hypothetical protein
MNKFEACGYILSICTPGLRELLPARTWMLRLFTPPHARQRSALLIFVLFKAVLALKWCGHHLCSIFKKRLVVEFHSYHTAVTFDSAPF